MALPRLAAAALVVTRCFDVQGGLLKQFFELFQFYAGRWIDR